jgi:hypothetical protein
MKYWTKHKVPFFLSWFFVKIQEGRGFKVTKTGWSGLMIKYRCSTRDINLFYS